MLWPTDTGSNRVRQTYGSKCKREEKNANECEEFDVFTEPSRRPAFDDSASVEQLLLVSFSRSYQI